MPRFRAHMCVMEQTSPGAAESHCRMSLTNRRNLLVAIATLSALRPAGGFAAPASRVYSVGFFFAGWSESAERKEYREEGRKARADLLQALAKRGYEPGRNLVVHWRFFDMDFSKAPTPIAICGISVKFASRRST